MQPNTEQLACFARTFTMALELVHRCFLWKQRCGWKLSLVYQKFKLMWFKTYDFITIDMIIKTKCFLAGYLSMRCKGKALFWKRWWEATAQLYLKRHAWKQPVSVHQTVNGVPLPLKIGIFFNNIIHILKLKLHRHILGTPETYITYCKNGHNRSPLNRIIF